MRRAYSIAREGRGRGNILPRKGRCTDTIYVAPFGPAHFRCGSVEWCSCRNVIGCRNDIVVYLPLVFKLYNFVLMFVGAACFRSRQEKGPK